MLREVWCAIPRLLGNYYAFPLGDETLSYGNLSEAQTSRAHFQFHQPSTEQMQKSTDKGTEAAARSYSCGCKAGACDRKLLAFLANYQIEIMQRPEHEFSTHMGSMVDGLLLFLLLCCCCWYYYYYYYY